MEIRQVERADTDLGSVSLAYGYGWRNAGDLAINQGSLKFLNTLLESVVPQVVSIHPEGSEEYEKTRQKLPWDDLRYELLGGPMHYSPKTQSGAEQYAHLAGDGLRYALDMLDAGVLDRRLRTGMAQAVEESDFLFYNGGNLIHHNRSLPYLLGVLYPIHLAKRHNTPYGLLPHTIFDIEGQYERLITSILEGAEFVWTRDGRSYDYLSSQFSLSTPVLNGIDTAFFLAEPGVDTSHGREASDETPRIAVVPRFSTLGDTGSLEEDDSEIRFERFLSDLTDRGYEVVLTVQTKVEEKWVRRNRETLREAGVDTFESYDPQELRAHYDDVDLLVTMRLHAGVFALSVGTPAVGVYRSEWGPKTPGTWENLGIGELAISDEEATVDTLLSACERVLENHSELQETIRETVTTRKRHMLGETNRILSTGTR